MGRCKYELFVEKYFGLNPEEVTENTKITTDFGQLVNLLCMFNEEQNVDAANWSKLENIARPEKWLSMYEHYQEILLKEDVAGFWQEQFQMAIIDRGQLGKEITK